MSPTVSNPFTEMVSVLVVDDESDIRDAVAEVLADEGYVVHGAGDGAEALRKARAVRPSVVLLDLMMPGMNGWEFRAAQKGDPDIQDIPVIVLSALGRVSGMDAADYIQKPFDLDQLLSAVRAHAHDEDEDTTISTSAPPLHAPQ